MNRDTRDAFLTALPRFVHRACRGRSHSALRRETRRSCLRDDARFDCAGPCLRRRWWPHSPIRTMIGSLL
jgi:hypothetical protein